MGLRNVLFWGHFQSGPPSKKENVFNLNLHFFVSVSEMLLVLYVVQITSKISKILNLAEMAARGRGAFKVAESESIDKIGGRSFLKVYKEILTRNSRTQKPLLVRICWKRDRVFPKSFICSNQVMSPCSSKNAWGQQEAVVLLSTIIYFCWEQSLFYFSDLQRFLCQIFYETYPT